jgi:hypothetical protein
MLNASKNILALNIKIAKHRCPTRAQTSCSTLKLKKDTK